MKQQTWREYLESGEFVQCCQCNTQLEIEVVDERDTPVCPECSRVEYGYMEHEESFVLHLQRGLHASDVYLVARILNAARMHARELVEGQQCSEETLARVQADEDYRWDRSRGE